MNCSSCAQKQYCRIYSLLVAEAYENDLSEIMSYKCDDYIGE